VLTYPAPLVPHRCIFFLLILLTLVGSGCSSARNYYARIDRAVAAGHAGEGIEIVERNQSFYGSRSQVLYLMDLGMLQHLAGQFEQSNQSLAKAEELTEALYSRRLTSEAEAFLTTDNALPYEGEEFEKVLLNVIMAMNYAQLGVLEDALVEARKVDHKLSVLSDRHGRKMSYSKDPLARYVTGILYEAEGNLSDALVAYRLALDAFQHARKVYGTPVPELLQRDLLRLSEALGLSDEHEEYRRQFPRTTWKHAAETKGLGELVFVAYEGRAPLKQDVFIDVPISRDALAVVLATKGVVSPYYNDHRAAQSVLYGLTGHIIRIAVPRFVPRRTHISMTEARAVGGGARYEARLTLMEDVTAIAVQDLNERIVRTTAKAVARGAWKYALAEGVRVGVRQGVGRDKDAGQILGAIAGILAHTLAIASEEADKRSWATLPDRIQLGRVMVPPGTYDIEFEYAGVSARPVAQQTVRRVTIMPGEKRFITTRVLQ
jgi:hypothetical protein